MKHQSVSDDESAPFSSSFSSGSLIGNRKIAAMPDSSPSSVAQQSNTSKHCELWGKRIWQAAHGQWCSAGAPWQSKYSSSSSSSDRHVSISRRPINPLEFLSNLHNTQCSNIRNASLIPDKLLNLIQNVFLHICTELQTSKNGAFFAHPEHIMAHVRCVYTNAPSTVLPSTFHVYYVSQ